MANQSVCKTNLKGIGMGIAMYAANRDVPPPSLEAIVKGMQIAEKQLDCPTTEAGGVNCTLAPVAGVNLDALVACDFASKRRQRRRRRICAVGPPSRRRWARRDWSASMD